MLNLSNKCDLLNDVKGRLKGQAKGVARLKVHQFQVAATCENFVEGVQ